MRAVTLSSFSQVGYRWEKIRSDPILISGNRTEKSLRTHNKRLIVFKNLNINNRQSLIWIHNQGFWARLKISHGLYKVRNRSYKAQVFPPRTNPRLQCQPAQKRSIIRELERTTPILFYERNLRLSRSDWYANGSKKTSSS